jgi:hypothetical protein
MKNPITDCLIEDVRRHLERLEKCEVQVIFTKKSAFCGVFMIGDNVEDALNDNRKISRLALEMEASINAIGQLAAHIIENTDDDVQDEVIAEIKQQMTKGTHAGKNRKRKPRTTEIKIECSSKEEAEELEEAINAIMRKRK